MKDLFFLQRKTWFQFRKTCKKLGLKTSISSTKDLMMWWKTYFIFNERLDFNSERLLKILFWRLPYLQRKTWWFDERLIFSSTKDLIPIQKDSQKSWFEDFCFLQKKTWWCDERLAKFWFEDSHIFNERLGDVMKDLSISSTKDLMMWWKTCFFFKKKDLIPRNLRNTSFFSSTKDLMTWWKTGLKGTWKS